VPVEPVGTAQQRRPPRGHHRGRAVECGVLGAEAVGVHDGRRTGNCCPVRLAGPLPEEPGRALVALRLCAAAALGQQVLSDGYVIDPGRSVNGLLHVKSFGLIALPDLFSADMRR
jgi:hypothetical protein